MKRSLIFSLCASLAACSSSSPPSTTGQDSGTDVPVIDTPVVTDGEADTPTPQDQPPADVPMTPRCGTAQPNISSIRNTEGLVIGPDGTIYYSQSTGVGRLRAGDGMVPEPQWGRIDGATQVWGLALDPTRQRLYVGVPSARKIYSLDLSTDPPASSEFVAAAGSPNGLTLGPDGALWYTDFSSPGHVYRVSPEGMKTRVTASGISGADGIAFNAEGALFVTSYGGYTVVRLTLDGSNMESGRTVVATGLGSGSSGGPDGLNFDAMGRMYVGGFGSVVRLDADGGNRTTISMGSLGGGVANVEFGVGALPCTDLYVARSGALLRISVDTPGADVPWHRAP